MQFFEQELKEDLIRLEHANNHKLQYPEIIAKAITQLVFNMGARVIDMPNDARKEIAEQTMIMIRILLEGARHIDPSEVR